VQPSQRDCATAVAPPSVGALSHRHMDVHVLPTAPAVEPRRNTRQLRGFAVATGMVAGSALNGADAPHSGCRRSAVCAACAGACSSDSGYLLRRAGMVWSARTAGSCEKTSEGLRACRARQPPVRALPVVGTWPRPMCHFGSRRRDAMACSRAAPCPRATTSRWRATWRVRTRALSRQRATASCALHARQRHRQRHRGLYRAGTASLAKVSAVEFMQL
jgi:hypothetical protein